MKKVYFILFLILFAGLVFFYLYFDFEKKAFIYSPFVFINLRLPRLFLALFMGLGLSMVGGLFQGIFRNPLAEPYVLGVSSGCAFGTVVGFFFSLEKVPVLGPYLLILLSLVSGLLTVVFIIWISQYRKNLNLMYLLLTGVIVNTFLFALEFILITFAFGRMQNVLLWLFGTLPVMDFPVVIVLMILILAGSVFILFHYRSINLLSISRDFLVSKGINLKRNTYSLFFVSTLMMAVLTSVCGIIGFVGLIVPHLVRLMVGNDFKKIFQYSFILGPLFVIFSD
ncbi:MAG: iron ABC transporter permease, partial [bacterium]|nr:iron ABC transporter permease [bacterium]